MDISCLRRTERRALRRCLGILGSTTALIACAILAPKDMAHGANSRFFLTGATLALAGAGLTVLRHQTRTFREARLSRRYAGASRSMQDTLSYILHERSLGAHGRVTLLALGCVSTAGAVLTRWPQCAAIGWLQGPLAWTAGSCLALIILQPFVMRRHLVNAAYLKRCLRQQAAHIGFRPGARKPVEAASAQTADGFVAGGFHWALDDLNKNMIVTGAPGSGKTVAVLNGLLVCLASAGPGGLPSAGLILDPKGAYFHIIKRLFAQAGRSDDLIIFSPDTWATGARGRDAVSWNPLDTPDDPLEVASRIFVVMKLTGGLKSNDSFFLDAARLFVRHAFALYRAANAPEPASLLDLHRLCAEPTDEAYEYRRLLNVLARRFPDAPPAEVEAAVAYFETEWRSLPDKQRAGVRSTTNQLLDDFTAEPFAEMTSGPSTVRIADLLDEGKILYVHLPLADRERLSRILTAFIKLELQREVLRRVNKPRQSFLFADEYQTVFSSGDAYSDTDFFERSRESRHANIVAIQNLSSLLKKTGNRQDVMNFLGLCAVKVFLRNTERETNEWASNLFGERAEIVVTMSEAAQFGGWFSRNQTNYSRATQARRIVPTEAFVELEVPLRGDPARQFAGSVVHLGSRGEVRHLRLDWPVCPLTP